LGAASRQGEGLGWAGEEEGKGHGKGQGGGSGRREREGPQVTVEPGPLGALLRHWYCMLFHEILDTERL